MEIGMLIGMERSNVRKSDANRSSDQRSYKG